MPQKQLESLLIELIFAAQNPTSDYYRTRVEIRRQFGGIAKRLQDEEAE